MKVAEGFVLRPLGKEYIITAEGIGQVNFNKMISLNESAAYLWKEVQGREFTVGFLADRLLDRYDVSRETALADAEALAAKWIEAGIASE